MPKPPLGSQILQDTFEKLQEQGSDVVQGLKDLVGADSGKTDQQGDSGIEQLAGQQDPQQQLKQAQQQGLTPQQLAQKKADDQQQLEFFRQQVHGWDEDYQQLRQEEEMKKRQEDENQKQMKRQEIVQLQEEEARAAALQTPSKPKQGRGTAFMTHQAKQSMGTGELPKRPTN